MSAAPAGVALAIFALSYALAPPESSGPGFRVESDSDTAPTVAARCITHNINKKKPELVVRNRPNEGDTESVYLVLNSAGENPATFGVIRINQRAEGSHLTTWLPQKSLLGDSPEEMARRLIAGC